jgi:hypothetical protein
MLIPVYAQLIGIRDNVVVPSVDLSDPQTHPLVLLVFILEEDCVSGVYSSEVDRFYVFDDPINKPRSLTEVPREDARFVAAQTTLNHYMPKLAGAGRVGPDLMGAKDLHRVRRQ